MNISRTEKSLRGSDEKRNLKVFSLMSYWEIEGMGHHEAGVMNTYAQQNRGYKSGGLPPEDFVKYSIWGVEVFAVLLAVYLVLRRYFSWFILSPMIGDNYVVIFGVSLALSALVSLPFFSLIEEFHENPRRRRGVLRELSAFQNAVIRIIFAGVIVGTFLITLAPHASTYVFGKETVRTFNVEWRQNGGKNCSGYQVVGRSWITHDRICGLSAQRKAKINKAGTIEIRGIENAFGFRALNKPS